MSTRKKMPYGISNYDATILVKEKADTKLILAILYIML